MSNPQRAERTTSELRRANARIDEILEANENVATILDSITENFFRLSKDWRFTYLNKHSAAQIKILGKDPAALIGKVLWDEFPEVPNEQALRRVMAERIPVTDELYYPPLQEWLENHIYPTPDGGLVTFQRYITDRKLAEERLRNTAYPADALRGSSHTGSWVWNVTAGELRWSPEHFRIFGLDPRKTKLSYAAMVGWIHPHDRASLKNAVDTSVGERIDFEWHGRIIRPDGTIRHIHSLGQPAFRDGEHGEVVEYSGTIIDVTDRKRAEEQLRRSEAYLAEGQRMSHTGTWAFNVSTGELYWSLEHFRILGLDPDGVKPSLPASLQYIHADDAGFVQQALERAIRKKGHFDVECRIVRPDGSIRHIQSSARPVFTEAGDLTELVGTILDITERKEEEHARKELLRRLVDAQEDERRRISREMHDQFGQQLTALTWKLATLRNEYRGQAHLEEELAGLEAMGRRLDADLNFIVSQLRPPALDDLGLAAALSSYVEDWSEQFGIRADVLVNGMDHGRSTAEVDTALYRVVQEALTNVAKHAGATNVDILLEARPDHLSLIVEDDGVGFDPDRTSGEGPKGFGLVNMRERATLLGGTLDIESRPGRGTTVVVRIPP